MWVCVVEAGALCGSHGARAPVAPGPHAARGARGASRRPPPAPPAPATVAGERSKSPAGAGLAAAPATAARGARRAGDRERRAPTPPVNPSQVVSWLKQPGDKVKKGEAVVVVESDKADMEVESFAAGTLAAVVVAEGGVASVGAPIAFIAETDADLDSAKQKAAAAGGGGGAPAAEAAPAPVAAAPAAAAPAAAPAPAAAAPAPAAAAAPAPPPPAFTPRADGRVVATPYAKKLARELGVDLAAVPGTGPAGRVTADDVEAFKGGRVEAAAPAAAAAAAAAPAAAAAAPAAPAAATPAAPSALAGTTVPFTPMQAAVSKNMIASMAVPEFRVSIKVQTDALDALYRRVKPKGVTMSGLLAKACGVALTGHPLLYARTTADGGAIQYNSAINVAMAVAMPDGGLITPVIKHADTTDLYSISRTWADLVKRARAKALAPDEYNSGTFTISNLGMFGVDTFDAILPPGTGAILAVGGSLPTVVADAEGRIAVRKVMTLNLTADHRHVYGADAAGFLQSLKAVLEDPEQLTL